LWTNGGTCIKVTSGVATFGFTPLSCNSGFVLTSDADGVKCKACSDN